VAGTAEIVPGLADDGSTEALAREFFLTEDESEVFLARGIRKTNSFKNVQILPWPGEA
jgi:hypothetical protein